MTWPIRLSSVMTSESKKIKISARIQIDASEPFHEVISEEFGRSPEFIDLLYELSECHLDNYLSRMFKKDIYSKIEIDDYYIDDYYISTYDCYMQIDGVISIIFDSNAELNKFKLSYPNEYSIFVNNRVTEICHTT